MGAPEKKVRDSAAVDEAVIAQELVPTSVSDDVSVLLCHSKRALRATSTLRHQFLLKSFIALL